MVNLAEKLDAVMLTSVFSPAEHLGQIHELNRLFLTFLHGRARAGRDCLGMSESVIAVLAATDNELLERLAEFPRALFQLQLTETPTIGVMDPDDSLDERARHALYLTILLSGWNLCRASAYHARLFLGLSEAAVNRLRHTSLSDLPAIALAHELIRCAFSHSDRFWHELLRAEKPEIRQRLGLIALQPSVGRDWVGFAAQVDLLPRPTR